MPFSHLMTPLQSAHLKFRYLRHPKTQWFSIDYQAPSQ